MSMHRCGEDPQQPNTNGNEGSPPPHPHSDDGLHQQLPLPMTSTIHHHWATSPAPEDRRACAGVVKTHHNPTPMATKAHHHPIPTAMMALHHDPPLQPHDATAPQ